MNTVIWLALMIAFLVIEAATVTVVSMWFAAGALVAMIIAAIGGSVGLQVGAFAVVSVAMLACLRPVIRKYFTPKLSKTNVDAIIGTQGYVTVDVDNVSATGTVKLGAMEWTARSTGGAVIKAGTLIRVDKIEGVKVCVSTVVIPAEV